jgi:NAD(P)H-nitrite reductase large subunit
MGGVMRRRFDILIIGNSAAGLQALTTIRRHSRDVTVAIVDRENRPAYSRVLTPYYIGGKTGRDNLFIVNAEHYGRLGVSTYFGRTALELDAERHEVRLDDGTTLGFGKLLLAAGAEARAMEITASAVCTLRHLEDAEKLAQLLAGARSITAVGAGLVSLPFLSHAGPEIEKHLIISSNRVFSRVIDAESSAFLEGRFLCSGLTIHREDDITGLSGTERLNLSLASGSSLTTDMLLVGKGVIPNTGLAEQAGLTVRDGVLVDDCCRTNHPDIHAAGDAAEGRDFITGESVIQGNWITAVEQGDIAALNMLGLSCTYPGSMKNNITEVFGAELSAVGYCRDDAPKTASAASAFTGRYRKVFLDEKERVIGAVMIGETNDAGAYYRMVRRREQFPGPQILHGANSYGAAMVRMS